MGLSIEDAMEQNGSWDTFLMHHSGWFVQDDSGQLADWGALPELDDDEAEAASYRQHVEMPDSGRANPEGLDEVAAYHTDDDVEDGPFYPDDFISFDDEL